MKDELRSVLRELTELDGAPGFEHDVVRYLVEKFRSLGAEVDVDDMGNLYALGGKASGSPHLMIAAHSDEIGAIVRHIDDDGFLYVDALGGVSPVLFVGRRVHVAGRPGVVGTRPGHLQTPEERLKSPPIEDMYVDVGASSLEEVRALGIRVGSPIVYDSPLQPFANMDRLSGKAIDNRLGCAVLVQLFRELHQKDVGCRLTGLVTVQEEVGLRGARVAGYRERPDCSVIVDTLPVADTPDVRKGRMCGKIGRGPVLVLASASKSGGHLGNLKLNGLIERAAASQEAPLQTCTSIGYAVTDAGGLHLQRGGIPTAVLALPRRYSHSPVCTFDINDAVAAVKVLVGAVELLSNGADTSFL